MKNTSLKCETKELRKLGVFATRFQASPPYIQAHEEPTYFIETPKYLSFFYWSASFICIFPHVQFVKMSNFAIFI